jgi:hypothetical protein
MIIIHNQVQSEVIEGSLPEIISIIYNPTRVRNSEGKNTPASTINPY